MKNPNDPIRNGTRALPACSTVGQTIAPLRFPFTFPYYIKMLKRII